MKIEIVVSDDRTSFTIAVDGGPPVPMEHFLLLTREGERTRNLAFGRVEEVGRLLYGFYLNCHRLDQGPMREVLERVAEGIRDTPEDYAGTGADAGRRVM